MNRARVLWRLFWPTARTGAWIPLAVAAALAALALAVTADPEAGPALDITRMRYAALVAGLGAGFVLEDPAEMSVGAVPTPLLARRLVRLGVILPPLAVWWLLLSQRASALPGELPWMDLTLELAALVTVSLGAAVMGGRVESGARLGVVGAGAVLVLAATSVLVRGNLTLFLLSPDDPGWFASHLLWAAIGAFGMAAFVFASRDPARRRTAGTANGGPPPQRSNPRGCGRATGRSALRSAGS